MPSAAPTRVASVLAALCLDSRTGPRRNNRELSFPSSFFFTAVNHLLEISPSQPPPLLTVILFCSHCALSHCLFHSRPPPSLIPSHPRRLSISLLLQSLLLAGCLPLSGKQFFLSDQPTLCPFTVSSMCSLTPPRLLLFISFCPIIFPSNSDTLCFHSALLTVSIWMNTSHCISPPLSVLPSLSLHLHTVPSVYAKHWEAGNHHSVNLLLLHESAATFARPKKCYCKHKLVEP